MSEIKTYNCECCNFTTERLFNFTKHCATTKHIKQEFAMGKYSNTTNNIPTIKMHNSKLVNKYICECNKICTSRQSLDYHEKHCEFSDKYNKIDLISKELEKVKHCIETQNLDQVQCIFNKLKTITEKKPKKITKNKQTNSIINAPINIPINNTDNSVKNTGTIDNSINSTIDNSIKMSAINVRTYVTNNYASAEQLMILTEKEVLKLLELNPETSGEHCLGELILFHYGKHLFGQFIGDFIIKAYKNQNPNYQKFWASDVQRLTFLIRRELDKNEGDVNS